MAPGGRRVSHRRLTTGLALGWVLSTAAGEHIRITRLNPNILDTDWYLDLLIVFEAFVDTCQKTAHPQINKSLPAVLHILWTQEQGVISLTPTPTNEETMETIQALAGPQVLQAMGVSMPGLNAAAKAGLIAQRRAALSTRLEALGLNNGTPEGQTWVNNVVAHAQDRDPTSSAIGGCAETLPFLRREGFIVNSLRLKSNADNDSVSISVFLSLNQPSLAA